MALQDMMGLQFTDANNGKAVRAYQLIGNLVKPYNSSLICAERTKAMAVE